MLIYKYTSSDAGKLIIENGSFRFSQIEILNDPFEVKPSFSLFKKSIKESVRNNPKMEADFKDKSYIERESIIQRTVQPTIDEAERNFGSFLVLSLTKKKENLLMWSHYADSHRGLVIGFDYDNPFFHQTKSPSITIARDVKYSNKRPVLFDYRELLAGEVLMEDYREYFLIKSLWWEYEEQVRMLTDITALKSVGKDRNNIDIYLLDFPKECLKKNNFRKSDEIRR